MVVDVSCCTASNNVGFSTAVLQEFFLIDQQCHLQIVTGLVVYVTYGMCSLNPVSTTVYQGRPVSAQINHRRLHFENRRSKHPCQSPTFIQRYGQRRICFGARYECVAVEKQIDQYAVFRWIPDTQIKF